ncbi:hypothetical protein M0802_016352 [Mischocyttarus mexicanus]|nr:hypothetical protein M0802_016352 [Mischocyttarus mexicanus]
MRQKPNRNIVRYACRTRDLESALLDASRNKYLSGETWSEESIIRTLFEDMTETMPIPITCIIRGRDRNQRSHPPPYKFETDRRNVQLNNPPAGIRIALLSETKVEPCKLCRTTNHLTQNFPKINAVSSVPVNFNERPKPTDRGPEAHALGGNLLENVEIEAPVITTPDGQATSDVDNRVNKSLTGGKTLAQSNESLNTKSRNISSTINKQGEINDRRIDKEEISDMRIDIEDISNRRIYVEDTINAKHIINVADIVYVEEISGRRININEEVNTEGIDVRDVNVKKLVDEEIRDDDGKDKQREEIGK